MADLSQHNLSQIPIVTEHDLREFHDKHFGHKCRPMKLFFADDGIDSYDNNAEDSLGYYDDGTKRTLTDEQIAIFRHSEIQSLLKENRRLQAIAAEIEEGDRTLASVDPAQMSIPAAKDEPTESRFSRKRKAGENLERQQRNPTSGFTHRRIAREKDEAAYDHIELDY